MSSWEPVAPFRVKKRYPLTRSSDFVEPLRFPLSAMPVCPGTHPGTRPERLEYA